MSEQQPMPEPLSRAILEAAIREGRAGELLWCLFNGGTCTVDPETRKLVLITGEMLDEVRRESFG